MCQELLELIDREGGPVHHLERLVNLTSTNLSAEAGEEKVRASD